MIVIHAGMGKAGSSSVKRWLHDNASALRERGVTLLSAPRSESGEIVLVPYERGSIGARWIAVSLMADRTTGQRLADAFAAALAAAAERHGNVVVAGEAFDRVFHDPHEPTLSALQRLSMQHEVRVAYYARPQHTSLEARWRQAGYRSPLSPSVFIEQRTAILRYASTRNRVRSLAPGIDFEPRPFRRDMLDGGDIVADFASRFLGVEAGESTLVNRGLPLEVANLLHAAPAGMFWNRSYGNFRVKRIKRLLDGHSFPESERIALSRQVLRKYAHDCFASENAELGWEDFVPPPNDPDGTPGLEALDRLWRPEASPAELAVLFRALDAAIEE